MSHKLLPRLGSAIASTILSYAAVSLVGVDKAQAAVLTYNINGSNLSVFKLDTSLLTGIEQEYIRFRGKILRLHFGGRQRILQFGGGCSFIYSRAV
jgi:hypothetical protein